MFCKLFFLCLLAVANAAPQIVRVETPTVVETPAVATTVVDQVVAEPAPALVEQVVATPVVPTPIVPTPIVPTPIVSSVVPNCRTESEPFETQICTPRIERICQPVDVVNQRIAYEKKCKDIVSTVCSDVPQIGGTVLVKRSADPAILYANSLHTPYAASIVAPTFATVRQPCQEVTTQHCIDSPVVVDEPATLENCNIVHKVDCAPSVQALPKVVCDQVEHVISSVSLPANPFAYSHGVYLG